MGSGPEFSSLHAAEAGGVQQWSPGASHVAAKLLYKPERVYTAGMALAHGQVLGEHTPLQVSHSSLSYCLWVTGSLAKAR